MLLLVNSFFSVLEYIPLFTLLNLIDILKYIQRIGEVRMEKYLFDNSLISMMFKNNLRKDRKGVITDIEVSTLDLHVLNEVKIYWTLISNTTFPIYIQRDISIAILYKVIEERRVFDSYFNDVNSNSINIAREIYNILYKSSKSNIPVNAISHRILKFKKGRKREQVFIDLKNIIVEYQSVLEKNNLIDLHRAYSLYYNELLKNEVYKNLHKDDELKINEGIGLKRNYLINTDNVFDYSYENYSDMKSGIIELLNELINEKKIDVKDICILLPNYNEIIKRFFEGLNDIESIDVSCISNNRNIKKIDLVNIVMLALAMKTDCIHLFNDEEKFEFIRFIYSDMNFFELKENFNSLLINFRDEVILEKYSNIDNEAEFIKKFFINEIIIKDRYKDIINNSLESKVYISEELYYKAIDNVSTLFKEFRYIEEVSEIKFTIDFKIKYVLDNVSYFIGNREKLERSVLGGISVATIDDYYSLDKKCKHKIIFDAKSNAFDTRIESELNTEVAYLEDSILSNLNEENLFDFYIDFEINTIDEKIMKLFNDDIETDIYVFSSNKSVRGFDQQSNFYNRLFYLLRKV